MRIATGVIAAAVGLAASREAAAICREVHEPDSPPPVIEPTQAVLIEKHTAVVGETCPEDADLDAGVPDCDPVYGDVVQMTVQPRFRIGDDGARFALLMVTPAPPAIELEDTELFRRLSDHTAPRVEVVQIEVEDESLGYQCHDPYYGGTPIEDGGPIGCGGGGGWSSGDDDWGGGGIADGGPSFPQDGAVALETIGAYEVVRLSAVDRAGLAGWLDTFGYVYDSADLDAIDPYLVMGWTVIAVRVATDHAHDGGLEPLSFTWPGTDLRIPLAVARQPSPIHYPLTVYVGAAHRYQLVSGVAQATVRYAGGGTNPAGTSFLTRLELDVDPWADVTLDPVAFEVEDVEYQEVVTVTQEIHIPSSDCPPSSGGGGGGGRKSFDLGCCHAGSNGSVLTALAVLLAIRRRRRC